MLRNVNDALWYNAITPADVKDGHIAGKAVVSGEGCHVQDAAGRWYLDARAVLWNASLGYSNTRVADAIAAQAHRLPVAQLIRYEQPAQVSLEYAARLVSLLPGELSHVRFGNTGAQMTEASVFLSQFVRKVRGERDRTEVIGFTSSYHGTGGLATSLSGESDLHEMQAPLVPGVHHVAPWDLDGLRATVDRLGPDRVTAVILEPILGTAVQIPAPGVLAAIQQLCNDHDIHLIADEVTTGFGRTGALTRVEQEGVQPDMLILSKGITAGYAPLAALVTNHAIFDAATARPDYLFPLGSTADGHPLAMAAGMAVLDELADGSLFAQATSRGELLRRGLRELGDRTQLVGDVRGVGQLTGVDLRSGDRPLGPAEMAAFRAACEEAGLLVVTTGATVVLTPPLVITDAECAELCSRLGTALDRLTPHLSG